MNTSSSSSRKAAAMRRYTRSASLAITFAGLVTNTAITCIIFSSWASSGRFEPDSEWESTLESWRVDGVKLLWGLLSAYFTSAALVCALGMWGILKNRPMYIRFYRDYTIADFCFCAFFIALAAYGSFRGQTRAGVCEHLSHYPELMRDMGELGLSVENCEAWLENAVFVALGVLFVVMAIRLHFLLALSSYYSHLVRYCQRSNPSPSPNSMSCTSIPLLSSCPSTSAPSSSSSIPNANQMQRIFFIPRQPSSSKDSNDGTVEMVYAPVPLASLPLEMQVQAMEAWVQQRPSDHKQASATSSSSSSSQQRRESTRHHRRRSGSGTTAVGSDRAERGEGRIRLAVQPEEGLLPSYATSVGKA